MLVRWGIFFVVVVVAVALSRGGGGFLARCERRRCWGVVVFFNIGENAPLLRDYDLLHRKNEFV
jgi:hypothetical protein